MGNGRATQNPTGLVVGLLCAYVLGCTSSNSTPATPQTKTAKLNSSCAGSGLALDEAVTFNGQIKGIINANCLSCHGGGVDNKPPLLNTIEAIQKAQQAIVSAGSTGRMPLNGSLPATTKTLLLKWQAAGYPLDGAAAGADANAEVLAGNEDTLIADAPAGEATTTTPGAKSANAKTCAKK